MLKEAQNKKETEPVTGKRVKKPTAQEWFEQGYHAQSTNRFEEACVCYLSLIHISEPTRH